MTERVRYRLSRRKCAEALRDASKGRSSRIFGSKSLGEVLAKAAVPAQRRSSFVGGDAGSHTASLAARSGLYVAIELCVCGLQKSIQATFKNSGGARIPRRRRGSGPSSSQRRRSRGIVLAAFTSHTGV